MVHTLAANERNITHTQCNGHKARNNYSRTFRISWPGLFSAVLAADYVDVLMLARDLWTVTPCASPLHNMGMGISWIGLYVNAWHHHRSAFWCTQQLIAA